MILLSKTPTGKINEIKQQISIEVKRKEMHTKNAQQRRNKLIDLVPSDKRSEAIHILGEFLDSVRYMEKAGKSLFELKEALNEQESNIIEWGR